MDDLSDDELLSELGVSVEAKKVGARTPREERIIAGFEDIQRFVDTHGRTPLHGEERDFFERVYAVRLDRLRELPEARDLLTSMDVHGLLNQSLNPIAADIEELDDEAILAGLGVGHNGESDITVLRHVVSREERKAAEEIANRTPCSDFDKFKASFEQAESDLKSGVRQARPFGRDASIAAGEFFILSGQMVHVAESGEPFRTANGDADARLRVIYSNETESNLLLRSLQRALYKDDAGRRLSDPSPGPLFAENWEEDDIQSGTIYVLRSMSSHPFVVEHRELIHKIGVTGGKVETRIANAVHDSTYLLADVEVVASYKLADINRSKLEAIFHRIFAPAQIDLIIYDRFGHPVRPQEWFLVPINVINEAVERVRDGSITEVIYDPKSAALVNKG
jgi:T5orf172 domain